MKEGAPREYVKIYEAPTVFEASLIRRTLEQDGVSCLIPGEDMDVAQIGGFSENAIFVPVADRDRALQLLKKAWDFYEKPEKGEGNGVSD
jgi:hypothetical protein